MGAPHRTLALALIAAAAPPAHGQDTGALRFTSVSAGGAHSCGITADSAAYCWGRNDNGQLGDSSTTDRPTPVPVAGGVTFRAISAGGAHTCAIATDNSPYCWGSNDHGQLGVGTGDRHVPAKIDFRTRGSGRLRVSVISAGARHTCALLIHYERQDQAMCWGANADGQLGTGGRLPPKRDAYTPVSTFGVFRYISVSAGTRHTCAVSKEGTLYCWGANERGQLGNASSTSSGVPFPARVRGRVVFSSVTAGATHSCALTSEGQAACWGDNSAGQVGNGKGGSERSPVGVGDSLEFAALSAGGSATCGVRRDGGASCWGSNASGQFGAGAPAESPKPVPAVPGLALTAISLGDKHGCGLQADGSAFCWGEGESGAGPEPRPIARQP